MRSNDFRFSAKRAFLTYAQCGDLTVESVRDFLRDDLGATGYCVALEQHQDGNNHIHAYAEWLERLETRDARRFDVGGRHPNIQPVRSRAAVLKYVQKGGDFIGNCEACGDTAGKYGDIIRDATGRSDFLELVVKHHPRDACLYLSGLQQFSQWRWPDERVEYVSPHSTFLEPAGVSDWRVRSLGAEVIYNVLTLALPYPNPKRPSAYDPLTLVVSR